MHFATPAIVLHVRPYGESGATITCFSLTQGILKTLVRGVSKHRALLQPGNVLDLTIRKRFPEQLGSASMELHAALAALCLGQPQALQVLQYVCKALLHALPEGDPHPEFYHRTVELIRTLPQPNAAEHLAYWEFNLLLTLGYGLALHPDDAVPCPEQSALTYISPNTGRAVSAKIGAPYRDKLLPLPQLFGGPQCAQPVQQALAVTGFFLKRNLELWPDRPKLNT